MPGLTLKGKDDPKRNCRAVSGKLDQASCDILYKTVLIFEKAAYSLQDMKRSEYESSIYLYLSWRYFNFSYIERAKEFSYSVARSMDQGI
jgi:hypothetical protein